MHRFACVAVAGVAALSSPSLADFIVPDGTTLPWVRGETPNSLYAQWEVFSSPSGPNAPDVGVFVGGDLPPAAPGFDAYDAAWETSGSFITSGGNIYSFSAPIEPRVELPGFGLGGGFNTTVVLQVRTLGSEPDLDSFLLNGSIEPVEVTELFRDDLGGGPFGGTLLDTLVRFEVQGDLSAYDIDFVAAASSMSLDRVAIDAYASSAPCAADLDGDGELTLFDFLAFQNAFDAGDPIADFDGDGAFTLFDFLAFQNDFDAGCP